MIKKAIIVGGGIAGLAAALAFKRKGVAVRVYEKTRDLKNIGGGITIYPHGARALRALGVGPSLDTAGEEMHGFFVRSDENSLLKDTFEEFKEQEGRSLLSIGRNALQHILADALESKELVLGNAALSLSENEDSAQLELSDGSADRADLIVVADGIHSRLYRQTIARSPLPERYAGYGFWGGILDPEHAADVPAKSLNIYLGPGKLSWILTLPKGRQWWYVAARVAEEDFQSGEDKLSQIRSLTSGWIPEVEHALSAPQTDNNFAVPVRQIEFSGAWSRGRIAGIGDAVHAMGPTMGQGASTAILDALSLAYCVLRHPSLDTGLETFSQMRSEVVDTLYKLEKKSSDTRITFDTEVQAARDQKITESRPTELLAPLQPVIRSHPEVFDFFDAN